MRVVPRGPKVAITHTLAAWSTKNTARSGSEIGRSQARILRPSKQAMCRSDEDVVVCAGFHSALNAQPSRIVLGGAIAWARAGLAKTRSPPPLFPFERLGSRTMPICGTPILVRMLLKE